MKPGVLYVVNVHPVYSVEVCITRGIPLVRVWDSIITLSASTYTVWQFVVFLVPL